jgi:trehalose/maltose transport system permease protein
VSAGLLAAPTFVIVSVVIGVPLLFAIYLSLLQATPQLVGPFVGLDNYRDLFGDPTFRDGVTTTVIFTLASASLSVLLGVAIASLLATPFRGRSIAIAVLVLPWLLPVVVTSTMFRTMLEIDVGIIDYYLRQLGVVELPILSNRGSLLMAVIAVDVWRTTPFVVLLMMAAIRRLPRSLSDAASVDGASATGRFIHVSLPLLRPTIIVVLLFRLLDAARVFDLFWVLTNQQLDSVSTFIYTAVARSQLFFSRGNAGAVLFFLATSMFALAVVKVGGLGEEGVLRFADTDDVAPPRRPSVLRGIALLLLLAVALAPLAAIVRASLLTPRELAQIPPVLLPPAPSVETFRVILGDQGLRMGIGNSLIVAGITTSLCVMSGFLAAYAMTRLRTRIIGWALPALLAVAFLPQVIVLAPLFIAFRTTGLLDSYWALIIPNTAFILPLTTWVLVGFLRELPQDVEDAARIDGASTLQVITRVVAPIVAPGAAVAAALSFVFVYNEFLFANIFIFESSLRPVTVILADAISQTLVQGFGFVSAAALVVLAVLALVVLPLLALITVRGRDGRA